MKLEYILIEKNKKVPLSNIRQVRNILTFCFGEIGTSQFSISPKRASYEVEYSIVKHEVGNGDGEVFNLTFEMIHSKKQRCAEVLECAHNTFLKSKEAKQYHVIVSYDDVSAYYCNRAYPLFHEFERQIRNLVFKLLTKTFGALWLDATISDELKKELKARVREGNKSAREEVLIEKALHEMDMYQLEQFLFNATRDADPTQLLDVQLSKEALTDMDKEQIVDILESGRARSIWDRFFAPKIEMPEFEEKLKEIRLNRNKVAHCKPFYQADLDTTRKILHDERLLEQVRLAVDEISAKEFDTVSIYEIVSGFSTALQDFAQTATLISQATAETLNSFQRLSQPFKEIQTALQSIAHPFTARYSAEMKNMLRGITQPYMGNTLRTIQPFYTDIFNAHRSIIDRVGLPALMEPIEDELGSNDVNQEKEEIDDLMQEDDASV